MVPCMYGGRSGSRSNRRSCYRQSWGRAATGSDVEPERISPQRVAWRRCRGDDMRIAVVVLLVASVAVAAKHPNFDPKLPRLGAKFQSLPAGEGKTLVEVSCFPCHAADILVQQRL